MVDILMATYNGEKYISEQIDSILNQTYRNFKLIISDDASTDSTVNILKEYEKKDSRIKVIYNKKNVGYVKNFERLLKEVDSDYFMFSDQDDIWLKDKVKISYDKIKNEKLNLVYTDLIVVDKNLKIINKSMWKKDKFYNKATNNKKIENLLLANFVTGCTIICKSFLIKKILPLPDKVFPHDFWIAVVAMTNGNIGYINKGTILYRQHENNQIGSRKKNKIEENFYNTRQKYLDNRIMQFNIYLNRINDLNYNIEEYCKKSIKYFIDLKKVNKYSLKMTKTFLKIYKYEGVNYKIKMYLALHFPIIVNKIYNL